MKILFTIVLGFFTLTLTAQQIEDAELEQMMYQFDQAFIPVWYFVREKQLEKANTFEIKLNRVWKDFERTYNCYLPDNLDWHEAFRRTDVWLSGAIEAIHLGHAEWAYNQLDHARYELVTLRRRHGIDYALDDLMNFEIEIYDVLEIVNDPMLCLLEWQEFEFFVTNMNRNWENLLIKNWDVLLFELDALANDQWLVVRDNMITTLEHFNAAVNTGDQCVAIEAGKKLAFAIDNMLVFFGDFECQETLETNF